MRVLFLITSLDTGGAEILLERLMPHLTPWVEPFAVSLRPLGPVGRRMREAGYSVGSCDMAMKYDPRGLLALSRHLRAFRADVVHSHLVHANLLGRLAALTPWTRAEISSIHNERFEHRWEYEALRATDSLTSADVCIGRQIAVVMTRSGVVSPRKVRVIPNGVDADHFHPASMDRVPPWRRWGFADERPVFGFVGRLEPQKDVSNLLAAAAILESRKVDVGFVVIGDGSLRAQLEAEASTREVRGSVKFVGETADMPDAMRSLDALVLPSAWEGLPLALLEAMACGLPVVSTDVGSVGELLGGGAGGVLVPPRDPVAFADGVAGMLGDVERARSMGAHNREIVLAGYSLQANAAELITLYRQVLARPVRAMLTPRRP
ncbi:MAG: glycosyltransferase [Actinobacteria bacterium]|nr:glycosyltransferase [Actinomycetota bacterium]